MHRRHILLIANETVVEVPSALFANDWAVKKQDGLRWQILAPYGDWPNAQGLQRFTREDAQQIVNEFNGLLRTPQRMLGLPFFVGHPDHPAFSDRYRDTKAYGRIKQLDARDDGLYAGVKFNGEGEKLIADEAFQGHSVNWFLKEDPKQKGVWRPFKLKSVGFTNEPNIPVAPFTTANEANCKERFQRLANVRFSRREDVRYPSPDTQTEGATATNQDDQPISEGAAAAPMASAVKKVLDEQTKIPSLGQHPEWGDKHTSALRDAVGHNAFDISKVRSHPDDNQMFLAYLAENKPGQTFPDEYVMRVPKAHGATVGKPERETQNQRQERTAKHRWRVMADMRKPKVDYNAEDIHLGALAKGEFQAGKNPASWVEDEDKWNKAKDAALKGYDVGDDAYWPVVTSIYKKMGGGIKAK